MNRRPSRLIGAVLSLSLFSAPAAVFGAQPDFQASGPAMPGPRATTRAAAPSAATRASTYRVQISQSRIAALGATQTSDIQVSYTGFSPEAQATFEAAVNVWESILVSSQVIHVSAEWEPLAENVLGSAGPTQIRLHLNEGFWYPIALSEARCSCERSAGAEISASFNSNFDHWYLGTDGNVPSDKVDFFSVVLHEIGHGIGFISSFNVSGGIGYWGWPYQGQMYPLKFDSFERTAATGGNSLMKDYPNDSGALKTQLTDGSVFFAGPNAVAAAGERVKLFAPNPWQPGSSNSHVDQVRFSGTPDSLMTPSLAAGVADPPPGPISKGMLKDIGWTIADGGGGTTQPANDNFADALTPGINSVTTVTTTDATVETNEPPPSCATGTDKTVWFAYTPGTTRTIIANTVGSNFDTVLAMYTGPDLASLTPFACSDNRAIDNLSKLKRTVSAGTTYWFQVGGANGASGSLTFRLKRP